MALAVVWLAEIWNRIECAGQGSTECEDEIGRLEKKFRPRVVGLEKYLGSGE